MLLVKWNLLITTKLFLQPFLERGFNYYMSDLKILKEKNEENEVFASSKAAVESKIAQIVLGRFDC